MTMIAPKGFLILALVFSISIISARQEAPLPSFEVASIKQDHSQDNSDTKTRLFQFPSPGRFHTINMPVDLMIQFAYNINPSQISGGPSWVGFQGYVIDAKVDDSLVPDLQKLSDLQRRDQMRLMVRSLLVDRFKLILSPGTKEMPIYALVVAKGGPKLKPTTYTPPDSSVPPPSPQERGGLSITPGKIRGVNEPISGLADTLALLPDLAGRTVRDQTGIKGNYDFEVEFAQEELSRNLPAVVGTSSNSNDPSQPSIFTALEEQLGLKLETRRAPVVTYTIAHIEEPSEN
jgi:uncharacterized protein (TIGR03435 family)